MTAEQEVTWLHKTQAERDAETKTDTSSLFIDWRTFWLRDRREAEWVLEPLIAFGRAHAVFAQRKHKKSLWALWAAASLAIGREPVIVVYLDFEMTEDDLYERLEDMGYGPHTDLSRLRYAQLPTLPPLDTGHGGAALFELVDTEQARFPDHHIVVIIDTTSRAVAGKENDADTIRGYYLHTGLGLKQRGVTVVRLDHAGKDMARGQRGTSAKDDDVDVVWRVVRTDDGIEFRRDAARMGWVPERVTYHQHDDPLRFVHVADAYPAGTKDVADLLDTLDVPTSMGTRPAGATLREAGHKAAQNLVLAAQRFRRERESEASA